MQVDNPFNLQSVGGFSSRFIPNQPPVPPPRNNSKKRAPRISRACFGCRKKSTCFEAWSKGRRAEGLPKPPLQVSPQVFSDQFVEVKCSSESPRCQNCEIYDKECEYDLQRHDRLAAVNSQNFEFVKLPKNISTRLSNADKKTIKDTLADMEQSALARTATSLGKRTTITLERRDVSDHSASRPDRRRDLADEDFWCSQEVCETGYMGRNSEVRWLKTAQLGMSHGENPRSDESRTINETNFYLDAQIQELDIAVDPRKCPQYKLLRNYSSPLCRQSIGLS